MSQAMYTGKTSSGPQKQSYGNKESVVVEATSSGIFKGLSRRCNKFIGFKLDTNACKHCANHAIPLWTQLQIHAKKNENVWQNFCPTSLTKLVPNKLLHCQDAKDVAKFVWKMCSPFLKNTRVKTGKCVLWKNVLKLNHPFFPTAFRGLLRLRHRHVRIRLGGTQKATHLGEIWNTLCTDVQLQIICTNHVQI